MLLGIFALSLLALFCGLVLGYAHTRLAPKEDSIVTKIEALLPQTQCAQCGYPGCRPYAQAIAQGEAEINLCPPGGETTIKALAQLLDREVNPLDSNLVQKPKSLAVINPNQCIGCTLCIQACPVDAIIGAPRYLHVVIPEECTGCELCVTPCPVDCIEMISLENNRQDIPRTI
ncbi:electron transport complex subunit RsxB [Candidatus Nitrosacidococcus sp. I8]|uniref:electron transport complex subunit RsxB n=1 Tax=Candidatus Nitrosacidococcus sp. I8 TaxID=2942908 RepID=UPI0022272E9A|nr:electron transport complex subunit RsxB [Candidatus Nitrosacidococcus sp. I8]CAH9018309.1 Ion-translocating oxidoreductase complex subunit B [Candidatus Nitrosacidococcus sp. I8]